MGPIKYEFKGDAVVLVIPSLIAIFESNDRSVIGMAKSFFYKNGGFRLISAWFAEELYRCASNWIP